MTKLLTSILLFCTTLLLAQIEPDSSKKFSVDFGGSFGVFSPFKESSKGFPNDKNQLGSNGVTFLQLNYKEHYFAKLQFGQTTVSYKSIQVSNGFNSVIDSKANSTTVGINLGYQYKIKHWQPFVMIGSGTSFIDSPKTSLIDENTISYTTKSGNYLYLSGSAGVNYVFNRYFIVSIEGQASTIPTAPSGSDTHLSGMSMQLGLKSYLFSF
ncbi:hypothetical protein SAMN05444671_0672 [Flavobacterium sp. CF108]|uniref:outer membrane beta-barrel protein n=1 Tax=unclassified Flavobacterium TaxID=196869 RepID=UPI0008D85EBF|nr:MULTISPECIES: outer membrane beta-barrel protein [unclassified Flavobacterium]SEO21148.1 hypothetical protein SAMN04487978_2406 [Flavobacterium sp. fv08]SHG51924.1 hypothetical protein SAMN05444671_0672 [Flavobacterium sp. CF108]